MLTLPGTLSEKPNFKFVINLKTHFSGGQKRKKLRQLGSLITSRHAVTLSSNFQKLMRVRYTSGLRTFQVVKTFFPKSVGS